MIQMRERNVLSRDLLFPEGPVWLAPNRLAVCELAGRRVSIISDSGERRTLARFAGAPNGQILCRDGTLVVCENGGQWSAEPGLAAGVGGAPALLLRVDPDGAITTLLDSIDGVPLTSPNDVCADADGGLWFTDPVWPLPSGEVPEGKIAYMDRDGARWVHHGLRYPNGLAFTPDGSALLVAESYTGWIHRFPVTGRGRLGAPERFGHLGNGTLPDGLCLDSAGRVLAAGAGAAALVVFDAQGAEIERLPFSGDITNVCFGGPDFQTVFVTEAGAGQVTSIAWDVHGAELPLGMPA